MLNIKDQVYLTIKIDGTEVNGIFIKDLTLAEGNGAYAPTMRLEADDPSSLLSTSRALSEGNTIEILISKTMSDPKAVLRKYRIFGPTRDNNAYNPNLKIIGVLDAPKYFTASSRESFTGTTDTVLRKVAEICGLKYVGPVNGRSLNDRQIWLDVCTSRARFIHETTRHGYMDDRSCMESIVTSTHELLYRNIIDEINTPLGNIKFLFEHSSHPSTDGRKHFIVKEARDRSTGGVMSHWVNYGSTRCNNNIDGYQKDRAQVDVKAPSPYLAINQEVSGLIKRARFDYAAIDCTNTHKEYQNALYQNKKLLALFTESMSILVAEVTDVKLLDPVIYRQADADPNVKVRNEDVYIVVGKTIVVRGGIHYAERIQLARISLEMKGTATLKSSLDSDSFGGNQVGGKNSVVSPASINQSAFGVAFNNGLKAMSSVSGALNAVSQTVTSLASVVSQLSTPSGAIAAATRLVLSGSPEAAAALSAVATQATSVLNTVNQAQNAYNSITGSVVAIAGQLSSLPKSVSVAALSQPNGVTSALSSIVRTLSVLSATSSTVSHLANALPIDKKTTESGRLLSANASAISSTLAGTANTASNLWNTAVSIVSGKSIPSALSPAGNAAGADMFNRLALLVATGGATAQTYQRLIAEGKSPQETLQILSLLAVQAEMLKSQTSPIWMTAGNFVKTFDTPQQSTEYIESATKYT